MTAKTDIFLTSVRSAGDLGGVFEADGETAYFYLYDLAQPEGRKDVGHIHVFSGKPGFGARDVQVKWNALETKVGLLIFDQLWAAFDADTRMTEGGDYAPGAVAERIAW